MHDLADVRELDRQARWRWVRIELAELQVGRLGHPLAQCLQQGRSPQGVASHGEEVGVHGSRGDVPPQRLAEELQQRPLQRCARGDHVEGAHGWLRQSLPVDLASATTGPLGNIHELRPHVAGQALLDPFQASLPSLVLPRALQYGEVGNQLVAVQHGDGLGDLRGGQERLLDLPELDALPPELHLVVQATDELQEVLRVAVSSAIAARVAR
mmetsp:Transcript_108747/g.347086  ORF Transcript_108747/g.347086 Transcript_108747/m.347086 type:complete len:212 (+) Transcript_108747:992-1627(+)